ncbi:MAG: MFS transporter, partial [Candidatus Aminicenantes bacterium]|nr:MFS transporter [Candidatus Aminicenantes bacterium]
MTGVGGNFWRVYLYKFLGEFYLIVPVLIPYYQANGLGRSSVFLIQAAYTLAVLALEIPSGYLADVVGRRRTLIMAGVFFPLGLVAYALGRSFAAFVAAELILALGNSLRSGCDSALLYDSLVELGRPEDYKKFEGRSFFFTRVGTASAAALGGALAVVALRLPFWVNIATGSLMLPVALSFVEPARTKLEA